MPLNTKPTKESSQAGTGRTPQKPAARKPAAKKPPAAAKPAAKAAHASKPDSPATKRASRAAAAKSPAGVAYTDAPAAEPVAVSKPAAAKAAAKPARKPAAKASDGAVSEPKSASKRATKLRSASKKQGSKPANEQPAAEVAPPEEEAAYEADAYPAPGTDLTEDLPEEQPLYADAATQPHTAQVGYQTQPLSDSKSCQDSATRACMQYLSNPKIAQLPARRPIVNCQVLSLKDFCSAVVHTEQCPPGAGHDWSQP